MSNNETASVPAKAPEQAKALMERLAARYGVDANKLYATLMNVAFRQSPENGGPAKAISQEEMLALLVVCEQYDLNPFLRQIYAFKSKNGVIVPVVGIDGWLTIINRQKDYDGMSIRFSEKVLNFEIEDRYAKGGKVVVSIPEFCECTIRRKNLSSPITIPEFADEAFVRTSPVWRKFPKRMLRHKAMIQCARVAFGISGIYDEDEAKGFDAAPSGGPRPAEAGARELRPEPEPRQVTDKMLATVVTQAVRHGNKWDVAYKWIASNVAPEQQAYAMNFVNQRKAEIEAQQNDVVDIEFPEPEKIPDVESAQLASEPLL